MATYQPDPIDIEVGARLRQLRRGQRRSQAELAAALGLTFQQVQKYETGANRLSASKIWEAAQYLEVSPSAFFELEDATAYAVAPSHLVDKQTHELLSAWQAVESTEQRAAVLNLLRSMATGKAKPISRQRKSAVSSTVPAPDKSGSRRRG